MDGIRKDLIDSHISKLRFAVRDPIRHGELRKLYAGKKFTEMVGFVRKSMNLDLRVRVGLVNSGGVDAPAWIEKPVNMPPFGTPEFRSSLITMYLRKSFLAESPFEAVVCAIAHEFSHVVLGCTGHELRYSEEATDLTAMMLGYRDFYRLSTSSKEFDDYILDLVFGYLTPDEVTYAANRMSTM